MKEKGLFSANQHPGKAGKGAQLLLELTRGQTTNDFLSELSGSSQTIKHALLPIERKQDSQRMSVASKSSFPEVNGSEQIKNPNASKNSPLFNIEAERSSKEPEFEVTLVGEEKLRTTTSLTGLNLDSLKNSKGLNFIGENAVKFI